MKRATLLSALASATMFSFAVTNASAAPLPSLLPAQSVESQIILVHGCHGSANVEVDQGGPHYHAEQCRRVNGLPAWDPRSHRYDGSTPRRSYDSGYGYGYGYGGGGYRGGYGGGSGSCWRECRQVAPRHVCRRECG